MGLDQELQKILRQEVELVFPRFDAAAAWELGVALRAAAQKRGAAVVIDIRRGDEILFYHAMPGTTPAHADWARRKRNVVELTRRSSYAVGLQNRLGGETLEQKMGLPVRDYACHGGGFPITVSHTGYIGSIVVSGMEQREDHSMIVEVLAELLGREAISA
ncbi:MULTISPECIES: heme-degrading domain-containing protein [unclassified Paludibacterium]|uniref:heme-degrading domain-containing protein n=1 Tax=unclassified Paludibacterium TaxID=2618429 RepID=UPI001C04CBCD|nr:heme-degrading domain-containing protein [Paludibacterium sp. B53371]BEV73767.1 heme-degrading domain-containing protein [Paludibacterium sp. THUN1379]